MTGFPPTRRRSRPKPRRRRDIGAPEQLKATAEQLALGLLAADEERTRGIRPRRALIPLAVSTAALFAMFGLVSQNVMALGLQASSTPHYIFTNEVQGSHAAIFVAGQQVQGSGAKAATQIGFKSARLHGFCLLAPQQVAGVGLVTLRLTAGEKVDGTVHADGPAITADNLFTATDVVSGNGDQISQLTLGQSADTVAATAGIDASAGFSGPVGGFGLSATTLNISDFNARNYAVDLRGSINLPNLLIDILPGTRTSQKDCS